VLGADVGGTFTDIVLADADGTLHRRKVPSTPPAFGRAVTDALPELLKEAGLAPQDVGLVLHATTAATNAILQLRGARTALITTTGFRDVLEIGRGRRPSLFDLEWRRPEPLVPRSRRFEVTERISAQGEVIVPIDDAELDDVVERLRASEAEAIAICLINSYTNPEHERVIARRLAVSLPDVPVSASCDVLPMIREYERTSTVCVNAYLRPLMQGYLDQFADSLRSLNVGAPLRLMQSSGGLTPADNAGQRPVFVIESGPGAGVIAASEIGRRHGTEDLIAFDMGGTTAKATLVESGQAHQAAEYEVGGPMTSSRLLRGGGYAIGAPTIDIAEVGAGGGSIFWIDQGGAPQVGPQSAGAVPGPACYGRGGEHATVTDANVVLGYLNPREIGGGSQAVDAERAAWVIDTLVAAPLGLDRMTAAWGIHTLANASMGRAVRSVSMQRGRDPRDFTLMAFGGSGPIHAVGLAQLFQIGRAIVPPSPGLLSAVGLVCADMTHDAVLSYTLGRRVDPEWIAGQFSTMTATAGEALGPHRPEETVVVERSIDLRYRGQAFELTIPVSASAPAVDALDATFRAFDAEYLRTYGHNLPEEPIEVVALRLRERRVDSARSDTLHAALGAIEDLATPSPGSRNAYFGPDLGQHETPIVRRSALKPDGAQGPLLIEEMDSTTVIPPGCHVSRADDGSLLIGVGGGD
jgi:N-methylhydantoinase A